MQQNWKIQLIFISISLLSLLSAAQKAGESRNSSFGRKYMPGDIYRYKLTTDELNNGKWESTIIVVCELRVVKDSASIPYDEVHWLSKKVISTKDTIDKTSEALAVKPYRISLNPAGRLDIPKIEVPGMTGAITDFNTFFVAVGPQLGATNLEKRGDSIVVKEFVRGDFSNGKTILTGDDCLAVTVKLLDETKDRVILHTAFMPPTQSCLSFLTDEMKVAVVKDTINNFQMVQPSGKDQYNVQFGMEWFYINSTVRKSNGKILNAEMSNMLTLKLRLNCNKDYKNCQAEFPFSMQRKLRLELLQE
jgi:hypothetical protein